MHQVDEIHELMVTLLVGGEQVLFVMLASDGSMNRLGTGALNNTERDMFIGRTTPEAFQRLRDNISNELLAWCGQSLSAPEKVGKVCELTVGFKKSNGEELVSVWRYGSESQGPPPVIGNFVVASVQATEPWYEKQKAMTCKAGQRGGDKEWWQFWK